MRMRRFTRLGRPARAPYISADWHCMRFFYILYTILQYYRAPVKAGMMMVSWGRLDVQESACFTNVFELLNPEALHVVRGEACHVRRFFFSVRAQNTNQ